jgi:hypothetical protein
MRKLGRLILWPGVLVLLVLASLTIMVVTVVVASKDPPVPVHVDEEHLP